MDSKEWFKTAQYGMMAHFGIYSLIGGEWKNKRITKGNGKCPYGEWSQSYFGIPIKEYEEVAKAFNPVLFNADEWIKLAKDAGMKYFVFTSKHHDGFALYHSKVDKFNVVDFSPFKRDIVGELAESCYKYGLKFGLYYSQDLDWHEMHGGGYNSDPSACAGISWDNSWDFKDKKQKNYDICFENKIYPQVEEILTQYGDLCLIWFDVPMTINEEQSRSLYNLVKKHQPNCLINSRIGNGMGDYTTPEDNEIPDEYKTMLFESACTLNDSWGYVPFDTDWKSAEEIRRIRRHLNERGINYLLNVGPDYLGRIPEPTVKILLEAQGKP